MSHMPIRVQNDLPVKEILEQENIFVMDEFRAAHQDIRPISRIIFILNCGLEVNIGQMSLK